MAAAVALVTCAGPRVEPGHAAADLGWGAACYDDVARVADELAGPSAWDCGLLRSGASVAARDQFRRCALAAFADDAPLRMGRASVLPDATRCTVALRAEGGQLWELYYDFDYDDGAASDGGGISLRWVLRLSRCEAVDRAGYEAWKRQIAFRKALVPAN